jgi:TolB protein
VWSPDGTRIAFQSIRGKEYDIDLVHVTTRVRARLTSAQGYDGMPTWSPDGREIAFVSARDGYDAVYQMDADGGHPSRMTTSSSINPAWSR